MKLLNIAIISSFFVLSSCKAISQTVNIDTVKVYYLPWDLKTKGALTAKDVRNFNNGKNHYFEISTDSVIVEFDKAINVYNFQEKSKYNLIDVRMVLDFVLTNGEIFTIELGSHKEIKIDTCYFPKNHSLNNVINKFIPEELSLKGEEIIMPVKKGTLSEKEIIDYKKKGVKIIEQ